MQAVFQQLSRTLSAGESAVLVTILESSGSTPRGEGSSMVVTARGREAGSIGGGMVEFRSEQIAQEVLRTRESRIECFELHPGSSQELGMICGGAAKVEFRFFSGEDGEEAWAKEEAERLSSAGRVYIFGGGHVAQALVPALAAVDFRCVVLEDREEFCKAELFPEAEEVRLIDNDRVLEEVEISGDDWVVIMTRGHQNDLLVQSQVMSTPARYIGVIGSQKKAAALTRRLREMGWGGDDFRRVYSPVGLPIRSETPAEIAVSITAQLILERAGGLAPADS